MRQRKVPSPVNINGPRPNYSQPSPLSPATQARVEASRLPEQEQQGPIPRWFTLYYAFLCGSIFLGVAGWFVWFQNPHHSHVSYDPLVSLPTLPRLEIQHWYANYADPKVGAIHASGERSTTQVAELLAFLERFQHAGYFDPELAKTKAPEHYVATITEGWISGVFERALHTAEVEADEVVAKLAKAKAKEGGQGQEGVNLERKRQEALAKRISSIVELMDDSGAATAATSGSGEKKPSDWSLLSPEHRTWVLEGLAHCHSSGCRLLRLALISSWRESLARNPKHVQKANWQVAEQLFHPETIDPSSDLLDAPASSSALAGLWFRFFGSGETKYLRRLVDLASLTGAKAYQAEKDKQARTWYDDIMRRRAEANESAKKAGQPPPTHTPLKPLPASPTAELHAYFVDSLRYYAQQHSLLPEHPEHPLVAQVFREALANKPDDPTLRALAAEPIFREKTQKK